MSGPAPAGGMSAHLLLPIRLHEEDGQWVAVCDDLDVSSFGDSVPAAVAAIDEALQVYLETLQDVGELHLQPHARGPRHL